MTAFSDRSDKDVLSFGQRTGEIITVFLMLCLFAFLAYHQWANTGFYTEKFGALEMICLYVPIFVALSAPLIRAAVGQRNPARPFEAAGSLFLAVGSLVLLTVFPFNYAHLADALPEGLRFILAWVTNDIAKVVLLVQVIFGSLAALVTMWKYFSVRQHHPVFEKRTL